MKISRANVIRVEPLGDSRMTTTIQYNELVLKSYLLMSVFLLWMWKLYKDQERQCVRTNKINCARNANDTSPELNYFNVTIYWADNHGCSINFSSTVCCRSELWSCACSWWQLIVFAHGKKQQWTNHFHIFHQFLWSSFLQSYFHVV